MTAIEQWSRTARGERLLLVSARLELVMLSHVVRQRAQRRPVLPPMPPPDPGWSEEVAAVFGVPARLFRGRESDV